MKKHVQKQNKNTLSSKLIYILKAMQGVWLHFMIAFKLLANISVIFFLVIYQKLLSIKMFDLLSNKNDKTMHS